MKQEKPEAREEDSMTMIANIDGYDEMIRRQGRKQALEEAIKLLNDDCLCRMDVLYKLKSKLKGIK